jgi:hypothetical protein
MRKLAAPPSSNWSSVTDTATNPATQASEGAPTLPDAFAVLCWTNDDMSAFVTSDEVPESDTFTPRARVMSTELADGDELRARLMDVFDITVEEICDRVLLTSQAASRSYMNGLYPNAGAGLVRWLHLVRNLSLLMLPRGWERCDIDNVPRLIHRERRIALVVVRGDDATGLPHHEVGRDPRSKYPRGSATIRAVHVNDAPFLPLFAILQNEDVVNLDEYKTWFLVVHVDAEQVRAEISLPIPSDSVYLERWHERLLLPKLPNDGGSDIDIDINGGDDPDAGYEDIDIPVEPL